MDIVSIPCLPLCANLHVLAVDARERTITIHARVAIPTARCPYCGQQSDRVHSTYNRRLRALPWDGLPTVLLLCVRRFFCRVPTCVRRTFVEQVVGLTRPHAQRTCTLNGTLLRLGVVLGGEGGARLGAALGILGSGDTILRRVHTAVPPAAAPPQAIGLDDWALRRGVRYGTLIVDLEQHRVLDILPDHTPAAAGTWLMQHPTVAIIARDRASWYQETFLQAAPQARQVADRWHLAANVGTALQECLARHAGALRATARMLDAARRELARASSVVNASDEEACLSVLQTPRQLQFAETKRLQAQGWSMHRISRELCLHRRTVRRYCQAEALCRAPAPQTTSSLVPYLPYLQVQWAAGETTGTALLASVRAQGYTGSLGSMYRLLRHWRTGDARRHAAHQAVTRVHVRSPRQAMWLLLRPESALTAEERAYRAALCEHEPLFAAAALARRFLTLLHERDAPALESWLIDAAASRIAEFVGLARSLRRDHAAVAAALETPWSNGMTEGFVHKVKLVKRSMYGRASVALIRQRVLLSGQSLAPIT